MRILGYDSLATMTGNKDIGIPFTITREGRPRAPKLDATPKDVIQKNPLLRRSPLLILSANRRRRPSPDSTPHEEPRRSTGLAPDDGPTDPSAQQENVQGPSKSGRRASKKELSPLVASTRPKSATQQRESVMHEEESKKDKLQETLARHEHVKINDDGEIAPRSRF